MIKLKPINVLNDNVAVLRTIDIPDGVEVNRADLEKISNEGVVVGIGPLPPAGYPTELIASLLLGDKVIFRPNRYLEMRPASGGYEGESILIMRKIDVLVRIGKSDNYEFETNET